jgi:enoyl-[acyl-carrier-protein] reductase (NADH)
LSDAKSDITKVLSIIKGTTGPIGWLVEAGEIAWNSVNIYQDISSAVTNFQNQQYFDCGYDIGAIVYILI